MRERSSSSRYFWLSSAALLLAIATTYSKTLWVPFYLDDWWSIHDNPDIRTLSPQKLFEKYPTRFLVYYSFALNYALHRLWLPGYHLVNIALHFLNSLLVWAIGWRIGHLQKLGAKGSLGLALTAALLFALHPLQTQAVNYTVQRAALLAAFCYLLSLWSYLKGRLDHPYGFPLAAGAFGLGLLSKENIVTLPLAWLLLELTLFYRRAVLIAAACVLFGLALLGLAVHTVDHPIFRWLDQRTRETDWFSRTDYFAAQTLALWHYLKLFFWPSGLRLDYALHEPPSWSDPRVPVALAGHLLLLGAALSQIRSRPVVAFGILFDYLAHAVESSAIPIKDLIFEHRTYLPNFGLALACSWLLTQELGRWLPSRAVAALAIAVLTILAVGSYRRNLLWRDPVALWRDNVEKAPHAIRAWQELAMEYRERGAMEAWRQAVEEMVKIPRPERLPTSTLYNLSFYYFLTGHWEEADRAAREALKRRLSPRQLAELELLLGRIAKKRGQRREAIVHFCRALQNPETEERARLEIATARREDHGTGSGDCFSNAQSDGRRGVGH